MTFSKLWEEFTPIFVHITHRHEIWSKWPLNHAKKDSITSLDLFRPKKAQKPSFEPEGVQTSVTPQNVRLAVRSNSYFIEISDIFFLRGQNAPRSCRFWGQNLPHSISRIFSRIRSGLVYLVANTLISLS